MKTTVKRLRMLIELYPRLAIAGGPKSGKTTLALAIGDGRRILHGDSWMGEDWSETSRLIAGAANCLDEPFIVEGVQVPRALRKGMKADAVIWLDRPHQQLTPGQESMAKGCKTVLREWQIDKPFTPVIYFEETPE